MTILLGKFKNSDNIYLDTIINCYQDYFTFKVKKNDTFLYLDTNILNKYLKDGIEIKYRKEIFAFLKNNFEILTNKSYKLLNLNEINIIDKYKLIFNELLSLDDIENLKNIINISSKILKNKNKFKIIDKNNIKLNKNFYANIQYSCFFCLKDINKTYQYNGLILNNIDNHKNKIFSIFTINHINNTYHNIISKNILEKTKLQINTKCSLIITEKVNFKDWTNIINKCNNFKIMLIKSKQDLKNIYNKDILYYDFLIIDIKFIYNKYFNEYFQKYSDLEYKNINISIINSLYENSYNKNIEECKLINLYLFKWNNIIFDNINKIINLDKNNLINNLSCNHTKYFILNDYLTDNISNYIINNSILYNNGNRNNSLLFISHNEHNLVKNNNHNNDIKPDNFYYFLKKELLIKNHHQTKSIENIFIDLTLSDYEKEIYNILFEDFKNMENIENAIYKKISLFFINSFKYNFKEKKINEICLINNQYYKDLIQKEEEKITNIETFFKNKDENEDYNNYINAYFNTELFFNESEIKINNLIKIIKNNINKYNLKIQYFEKIINEFNDKEYSCTICLDIIDKSEFTILNCGHYFCKKCLSKYIEEKDKNCECPNCRSMFELNNIYLANNTSKPLYVKNVKIEKINELISLKENKKILIVSQYKENIILNKLINIDNVNFYHLFYKNNYLKERNKNFFTNNNTQAILLLSYNDIIKYSFHSINCIIFIDYPKININKENVFKIIKNNYSDQYLLNNNLKLYYLYITDSFEEHIITKNIKIINEQSIY